ncbi:hypothetical protein JHK85_004127 [Glycine max]|nr:hypothetical protein JHK85_004127 [Glycine max]KAG5079889.1 hypothetical protein JHK86_003954 [Glycine max]
MLRSAIRHHLSRVHSRVLRPVVPCLRRSPLSTAQQAQNLIDLTLWADEVGDPIGGGWVSDMMKELPKFESLDLKGGYIEIRKQWHI